MTDCEYVIESGSVEETRAIGRRIGEALRGGEAIALIGGLGAGKTQLVKGIAAGAGVADQAGKAASAAAAAASMSPVAP